MDEKYIYLTKTIPTTKKVTFVEMPPTVIRDLPLHREPTDTTSEDETIPSINEVLRNEYGRFASKLRPKEECQGLYEDREAPKPEQCVILKIVDHGQSAKNDTQNKVKAYTDSVNTDSMKSKKHENQYGIYCAWN